MIFHVTSIYRSVRSTLSRSTDDVQRYLTDLGHRLIQVSQVSRPTDDVQRYLTDLGHRLIQVSQVSRPTDDAQRYLADLGKRLATHTVVLCDWQTHQGRNMDPREQEHESR